LNILSSHETQFEPRRHEVHEEFYGNKK
jgi:hypothetical protein